MDPEQARAMMAHMMLFALPLAFIFILIVFIPYWFIFKKAGFSPWLALLMFVPLGNIVMLYVLAFADWKVVPIQQAFPPQYPPPGYPPLPPRV